MAGEEGDRPGSGRVLAGGRSRAGRTRGGKDRGFQDDSLRSLVRNIKNL